MENNLELSGSVDNMIENGIQTSSFGITLPRKAFWSLCLQSLTFCASGSFAKAVKWKKIVSVTAKMVEDGLFWHRS